MSKKLTLFAGILSAIFCLNAIVADAQVSDNPKESERLVIHISSWPRGFFSEMADLAMLKDKSITEWRCTLFKNTYTARVSVHVYRNSNSDGLSFHINFRDELGNDTSGAVGFFTDLSFNSRQWFKARDRVFEVTLYPKNDGDIEVIPLSMQEPDADFQLKCRYL